MSKIVSNYTANGSSTTDEYGTFVVLNRLLVGDVVEGLAVAANSTANMTVYVQPGSGRITTGTCPTSYGYLIAVDTAGQGEAVTIATAAASARIDYIVGYIDKGVAGSTLGANVNNINNVLKFASVAGTPSGSPVVPTTAQIQSAIGAANPYIILAQIAVGANVTQITNANITDLRVIAGARSIAAQQAWQTATLQNGWVGFGTPYPNNVGYMKDSLGFVHIRGLAKSGTATTNTVIFTLPAGYRPAFDLYIVTAIAGAWGVAHIDTNGNVMYDSAFTSGAAQNAFSFDNIHFRAEK